MQFELGGFEGYCHDIGIDFGYFHTFPSLQPSIDYPSHKVHLFIPRDYKNTNEYYPVIYMNDGEAAFFNHGNSNWNIHSPFHNRCIQKLIIVGIVPNDRNYEYTHTFWCPGMSYGGLDMYSQTVVHIKEWIDQHYRTIKENTCIMGASHGGLASFYIANAHPNVFNLACCLSSSFWVGMSPEILVGYGSVKEIELIEILKDTLSNKEIRPKLWIDWGLKRDGGEHNELIERVATKVSKRIVKMLIETFDYQIDEDIFIFEDPIGGHDEKAWAYRFGLILEKFYSQKDECV